MLQPRPKDPFQRRVDLGQEAGQAVRDPGRLVGQVLVEPDDHLQLGAGLVLAVDRPQRRDDERVLRVRLGLTGTEVGDPPHRQARYVSDWAAHVPHDGQRLSSDRGRLVDHDQHRSVLGLELRE
ncbi:hypothetical protein GCM10017778_30480 [Streptomyces vinaceus]|nr:hypothetical protein GCM10017778_30480 [Streptomyces vinaceus]